MVNNLSALLLVVGFSTSAVSALSRSTAERAHQGHRGPPPEAIEACEGKQEGDACTVDIPDRDETLTGTCEQPPFDGAELACRPDGPPPGPPKTED